MGCTSEVKSEPPKHKGEKLRKVSEFKGRCVIILARRACGAGGVREEGWQVGKRQLFCSENENSDEKAYNFGATTGAHRAHVVRKMLLCSNICKGTDTDHPTVCSSVMA